MSIGNTLSLICDIVPMVFDAIALFSEALLVLGEGHQQHLWGRHIISHNACQSRH